MKLKAKLGFFPLGICSWRYGELRGTVRKDSLGRRMVYWRCLIFGFLFLFPGTSRSVQQFLAMCDRGETCQGVKYTGRTLNYQSLPHRSRTDASWAPWSETNQHIGARFLSTPVCKPQPTHTATLPERNHGLQVPHAQSWGDLFHSSSYPPVVYPVSPPSSSLHVPLKSAWNLGPVPGSRAPGPRRVDMPPDDDWRQTSYAPQSGHRRIGGEEFLFVLADAPGREQIRARALQHNRW